MAPMITNAIEICVCVFVCVGVGVCFEMNEWRGEEAAAWLCLVAREQTNKRNEIRRDEITYRARARPPALL